MQPSSFQPDLDRDAAGSTPARARATPAGALRRWAAAWFASPRVFALRALVYVLLVLGDTCLCLAVIVFAGSLGIWLGLRTQAGWKLGGALAGLGVLALVAGYAVFLMLDRAMAPRSGTAPNRDDLRR